MGREGEVTERSHSLHANFVTGPGGRLSWLQLPLPWALPFLRLLLCQVPEGTLQPPGEDKH